MTGERMYHQLMRRRDPLTLADLVADDGFEDVLGVLLGSSRAGREVAEALEADPSALGRPTAELVAWLCTFEHVGRGRAAQLVAAMSLGAHLERLAARIDEPPEPLEIGERMPS